MDDILVSSLMHLLHRASQVCEDIFTAEQPESNRITARQCIVLAAIAGNQGLNQTDIVRQTGIDRSTIADMVRRLVNHGLVSRRRTNADARAYEVKLTREGQRVLREATVIAKRTEERLGATLPAESKSELVRLLQAMTAESASANSRK